MCKDSEQQCMAIRKHVCDNRGTTMIGPFNLFLKTSANKKRRTEKTRKLEVELSKMKNEISLTQNNL
jgi:hypothetical protein